MKINPDIGFHGHRDTGHTRLRKLTPNEINQIERSTASLTGLSVFYDVPLVKIIEIKKARQD